MTALIIFASIILALCLLSLVWNPFSHDKEILDWGREQDRKEQEKKDNKGKCSTCLYNNDIQCTIGSHKESNIVCMEGELWEQDKKDNDDRDTK